jgi:hypothetical protein
MKEITKLKIKTWCFANILIPGLALISMNLTDNETAECHAPPARYTCLPFLLVIGVSVLVGLIFSTVIIWKYVRKKKALKRQLKKGIITHEQYQKLK